MTKVQGLSQLQRRFRKIPEAMQLELRFVMEETADAIVQEMWQRAPYDTGRLAESIGWTWGDAPSGSFVIAKVGAKEYGTMRITFYAGGLSATPARQARSSGTRPSDRMRSGYFDESYAKYIEFGTSKMRARPFFFPVWRIWRRRVKSRMAAAMRKALKARA